LLLQSLIANHQTNNLFVRHRQQSTLLRKIAETKVGVQEFTFDQTPKPTTFYHI
jgi:hypothetical protein